MTQQNDPKSGQANSATSPSEMNPGDEAPPGSTQTGEAPCRACKGKGKLADGKRCEDCGGTGKVIAIVGDA